MASLRVDAFVTENYGATGPRFVAHVEQYARATGTTGLEEGPGWNSLEAAIEWARSRSEVVLVRVGAEGWHSAGAKPERGLPIWTADTQTSH